MAWLGIVTTIVLIIGVGIIVSSNSDPTVISDPSPTRVTTSPKSPATGSTGGSTGAKTGSPSPVSSGEHGTRENPIPIGQPGDIGGGWTMTVNSVDLDATSTIAKVNDYNDPPPDGSTYVLINATLTYNGEEESAEAHVRISGVGRATNVASDSLTQSGTAVAPKPRLEYFTEVFKGGSTTGNVVFWVPDADLPTLVIIGDGAYGDDRGYFASS